MSFFGKFFSDNNKENLKPIISFEVFNAIEDYLYNENSSVQFKLKGFYDSIYINRYSFPSSFDHFLGKKEIKDAGLINAYELLNKIYSKIEIEPVSKQLIDSNYECGFIHFQFYTKPPENVAENLNNFLQNFLLFFCCENSVEADSFRIVHNVNRYFKNFTVDLLDTNFIDCDNPKNEVEQIGVAQLKLVLQGFFQHLNLSFPSNIEISNDNLLLEEINSTHFEELMNLSTRNKIDSKIILNQAKKLFNNFTKKSEKHDFIEDNYEFLESIDVWNSDWKFNPEDAEYFISEMIGFDLNFEFPTETYSHELFPYIKKALAKHDLELMSFDTQGDNYMFFVCFKKDVTRILELSQLTQIAIDKL